MHKAARPLFFLNNSKNIIAAYLKNSLTFTVVPKGTDYSHSSQPPIDDFRGLDSQLFSLLRV